MSTEMAPKCTILQNRPMRNDKALKVEFDEREIDAIVSEFNRCHLTGAAVGIAIDGKSVYRKGFGCASMELPVALSSIVRIRINSITKHVVCLMHSPLCADGKAGIDDPIVTYFPSR